MALGNGNYQNNRNGNNGNQNSYSDPNYYSRLRINNNNDKLSLIFTFWRGLLKVSIVEIADRNVQDNNRADELAYIHLSPTKARLMSDCVGKILDNPDSIDVFGINTGVGDVNGFMAIGRDGGTPYLVIAKVGQNGYESSQRFNFNVDYNYFLQVSDLENLKFKREYDNTVELKEFKDVLDDFARSASGAYGASFYDIGRYENYRTTNLIRRIAEKVGVESGRSNYNGGNSGNGSYFNNGSNQYSQPTGDKEAASKNSNKYTTISNLEDEF